MPGVLILESMAQAGGAPAAARGQGSKQQAVVSGFDE